MSEELINYLSRFVRKRRLELFHTILENRTRYIKLLVEDIYQEHNASALLRTCDCFGIQDVHIIEQRNMFDVNPEVAMGSSNWLTISGNSGGNQDKTEVINELRSKGYRIVATIPGSRGVTLREFDIERGPFVLMFGTEKEGLSSRLINEADESLLIEMFGFTESFNVSVSAGIILHHMRMKLMDSSINWKLNEIEKAAIKLEWLRKTIKKSDLIEREFIERTGQSGMI